MRGGFSSYSRKCAYVDGGSLIGFAKLSGLTRINQPYYSWPVAVGIALCDSGMLSAASVRTLACHSGGLEMVAFSPDGALLASCACDKMVCIWDVLSGQLRYQLQEHRSWVRCVAFSLDSTQVASGSDDGTVKLWDVTPQGAGTCLQTTAMQDPYTGMKIAYATGLTPAQKTALVALGAVEK